jgi:hypothetical protein
MNKRISLADAFFFYLSLFWRAVVLYLMINIVAASIFTYPLSILLKTQHPVPIVLCSSIITIVIYFFAMVIPVKTVLQKFVLKWKPMKTGRTNQPIKQITAPDHLRSVVRGSEVPLRSKGCSVVDESGR